MDTRSKQAARRLILALLLVSGLGGCAVYAPPNAVYDPYYSSYTYPTYVAPTYLAPPVFLDFGFYQHRYYGKHHGKYHGGHHGHGWRGHGGWGQERGWGHGRSWGHRRGGRY